MIGSQAAYARHRKEKGLIGSSRHAVQKALASRRITAGSDGRIDFDRADRDWEQNLNQKKRSAARVHKQAAIESPPAGNDNSSGSGDTFLEAQRQHEWLKVKKEELALRVRIGELAEISEIEMEWSRLVSETQDLLLGLPGKIAPRIAAVNDVHECQELLDREIRRVLGCLAEYQPNAA